MSQLERFTTLNEYSKMYGISELSGPDKRDALLRILNMSHKWDMSRDRTNATAVYNDWRVSLQAIKE
jgi:hypothetical protein